MHFQPCSYLRSGRESRNVGPPPFTIFTMRSTDLISHVYVGKLRKNSPLIGVLYRDGQFLCCFLPGFIFSFPFLPTLYVYAGVVFFFCLFGTSSFIRTHEPCIGLTHNILTTCYFPLSDLLLQFLPRHLIIGE